MLARYDTSSTDAQWCQDEELQWWSFYMDTGRLRDIRIEDGDTKKGEFVLLSARKDGGTVELFVNEDRVKRENDNKKLREILYGSQPYPFTVGFDPGVGLNEFQGHMTTVLVFQRALSDAEFECIIG